MKKSAVSWSVKQYIKMFRNDKISFDYPIQRQGNQWDLLQKSLLIHSLADDFPVPALYSIKEEELYYILDGKQRLTNIIDFVNNNYPLHEDTPVATIDGVEHELAERLFEELHEDVQDSINDYMILNYKLDEATDEEIEDLFFRLNNGTPLTKQQKAKAKMGTEWAKKIEVLVNHPFMKDIANFTEAQLRKADDETAILQTMMLIDSNHELKSISSNHVFDYTQTFKQDEENKTSLVEELQRVFNYLDKSLRKDIEYKKSNGKPVKENEEVEQDDIVLKSKKEKVLSKKVNFPMLVITAKKAMEREVSPEEFATWVEEFKLALKGESVFQTNYKEFGGAGSVKKEKTLGRIDEMERHFDETFVYSS